MIIVLVIFVICILLKVRMCSDVVIFDVMGVRVFLILF